MTSFAWRAASAGLALILMTGVADAQRSRSNSTSANEPPAEEAAPEAAPEPQAPPPPAVTFVSLEEQDITLTTLLPGRVVASGVAQVRPQVAGIITERLFEEGADVEIGDPMYRIDPATYEASIAAAKAQVAQAQAAYDAAEKEATRSSRLRDRGVVSDQTFEAADASKATTAAALQVAQAQLQQAQIDLDRTTVRAALSGVVGRSLTTRGALVTSGQATPLAIIRTIDPVLVDVTQSAAELIAFRRGVTKENLGEADLSVSLILADDTVYEETGTLTAAEPNVNESTGVVTLRLKFPNPNRFLLPGMYVQVRMPQGLARGVVLAPQEGVTRNRRGQPIAYVVSAENTIEQRDLTINGSRDANWIVTKGLKGGDRMVVAGLQRISPGATVRPSEREAPKAPEAPAAPESEESAAAAPQEAERDKTAAATPAEPETVAN
ncbi:efflux RND transporter periplasmic adaptor subunit [Acuticoccus sp. MNP-M23]|uniref:efflux RND transporter periplasmic adaptor subunit n=1 Tax=Acuticoccus sp. MNP-M23 TaxID=3072793 RepID=UPI0028152724|nr:efflux RND transporter periplasmic adaptor subunit [Acuticoccus sp. MNP-M23]WMS40754.1 efflux RND transporter periplasmic adaptor subunit [Acuticoccus sp. MNP-M23]